MKNKTGAILLAAGFSQRFGSAKLLATLKNGMTVFEQTYSQLLLAVDEVLVITRPALASQLQNFAPDLLVFDNAEDGMGSTLAFAMKHHPPWDAALICLADMPFISSATYRLIADASRPDAIIVPVCRGYEANPVSFGKVFFPDLEKLTGNGGGKKVLQNNTPSVKTLVIDDSSVLEDIDTPADLARLQS